MPIPSHLAKPHAVVFPFPVQGHINPMMSLAKYLSSAGVMITFVHSARSYALLQSKKSLTDLHMRVAVVPDGLPTDEKEQPTEEQLLESIHAMEKGFEKVFLNLNKEEHPPSCIISDNFLPWTQDVAEKYGIPRVEFWTGSATVYSIGYYLPQLVDQGYIPIKPGQETNMVDIIPGLLPFRVTDIPTTFLAEDIASPLFQFLRRSFSRTKEADRVLVASFYDLERSVIDAMRAQQIYIDPIGPLFPLAADGRITNGTNEKLSSSSLHREDDTCLEWLDAQEDSSVIYVSFGSMATLTLEETRELAHGLEGSHQPFLWVIRPDAITVALSDILPEGFESRTRERGRIISGAPQLSVLAHPSVGGFLTHCGWNSTLESLSMGVPMIGCPRGAEQNTNLKCTINWKVGMALEGEGKGGFNRDSVGAAIKALMQGEDGEKARRRALELGEAARTAIEKGSSRLSLEKLVDDIKQMAIRSHVQIMP